MFDFDLDLDFQLISFGFDMPCCLDGNGYGTEGTSCGDGYGHDSYEEYDNDFNHW